MINPQHILKPHGKGLSRTQKFMVAGIVLLVGSALLMTYNPAIALIAFLVSLGVMLAGRLLPGK